MRPTKNQIFCPNCKHSKMNFATKKEAVRFLKYNAETIKDENGKCPVRAYYCSACCAWHVTSLPNSHARVDLVRRFGCDKGEWIYNKVIPLIAKGRSIERGLGKKLKDLRHNLKFQVINTVKCKGLIDDLFEIFEAIIGAQLEDKPTIDKLLSEFTALCNIFTAKKQTTISA